MSIHLIFINDLDDGAERALSKSVDDTKLEGEFDTPDGCPVIQRYLDRLGKWANMNVMKFNEGKGKVLHLGRNKPVHQYMLKPIHLESSFAEKDTVNTKLNMSHQCALAMKVAIVFPSFIRIAIRLKKVIFLLYSALVKTHLECCVQF